MDEVCAIGSGTSTVLAHTSELRHQYTLTRNATIFISKFTSPGSHLIQVLKFTSSDRCRPNV